MSRVIPIDAESRDRLAREIAFIEAAQPIAMNDLITRDFACLALQDMDGRTDPRFGPGTTKTETAGRCPGRYV
jgi:hypothetical protein